MAKLERGRGVELGQCPVIQNQLGGEILPGRASGSSAGR